jgi:hypothetical protein
VLAEYYSTAALASFLSHHARTTIPTATTGYYTLLSHPESTSGYHTRLLRPVTTPGYYFRIIHPTPSPGYYISYFIPSPKITIATQFRQNIDGYQPGKRSPPVPANQAIDPNIVNSSIILFNFHWFSVCNLNKIIAAIVFRLHWSISKDRPWISPVVWTALVASHQTVCGFSHSSILIALVCFKLPFIP